MSPKKPDFIEYIRITKGRVLITFKEEMLGTRYKYIENFIKNKYPEIYKELFIEFGIFDEAIQRHIDYENIQESNFLEKNPGIPFIPIPNPGLFSEEEKALLANFSYQYNEKFPTV